MTTQKFIILRLIHDGKRPSKRKPRFPKAQLYVSPWLYYMGNLIPYEKKRTLQVPLLTWTKAMPLNFPGFQGTQKP